MQRKTIYTRYMYCQLINANGEYDPDFDIIHDLNENPLRYEDRWSEWIPYSARSGPDWRTLIPDRAKGAISENDPLLEPGHVYLLAVQVKSDDWNITRTFRQNMNACLLITYDTPNPWLIVCNKYFGCCTFGKTTYTPLILNVPNGLLLSFRWYAADFDRYGCEIACYRYGWDVEDINDPDDWAVECSIDCTASRDTIFAEYPHTLFIQAFDTENRSILAMVRVE